MNQNEKIIKETINFLQSDDWFIPILDFTLANCIIFTGNTNTIDQFKCFVTYCGLIEKLIKKNVCYQNNITIDDFEKSFF